MTLVRMYTSAFAHLLMSSYAYKPLLRCISLALFFCDYGERNLPIRYQVPYSIYVLGINQPELFRDWQQQQNDTSSRLSGCNASALINKDIDVFYIFNFKTT